MNKQIDFILSSDEILTIEIPDVSMKYNYYYEPTEKLHKFDEVTVFFSTKGNQVEIYKDILDDFITPFHRFLEKAIAHDLDLPHEIVEGEAGKILNYYLNERSVVDLKSFWLCSSLKNNDTLMYSKNSKIYIEIAPMYPWTFLEPKSKIITFPLMNL